MIYCCQTVRTLISDALFSSLKLPDNWNSYSSEPTNVTVMIGEAVRFNCSGIQLVAVWIIDGLPHDWTDFITTSTLGLAR